MFLYNEDCMCSDYKLVAIRAPHRTDETFFIFWHSFPITISKKELDYYQQKLNVKVATRFVKRLKNEDLRK